MKFRLTVLTGFALFIALLTLTASYRSAQIAKAESKQVKSPPKVNVKPLIKTEIRLQSSYYGMVHPRKTWQLSFPMTGTLKTIPDRAQYWQEGDVIPKGTLIAQLKEDQWQAQIATSQSQIRSSRAAIAVQKATVNQMKFMVKAAQATLEDSQARVNDAKLEMKRLNDLEDIGSSLQREKERTQVQLDSALALVRRAQAQLAANQANLLSAQAQLAVLDSAVDTARTQLQQIEATLNDTKLLAPADIVVAGIQAEPGQTVTMGSSIMEVADLATVHIHVGIPESKISRFKRKQTARVKIDAIDSSEFIKGVIEIISPAASREDGLFYIEVAIPNSLDQVERILRPGMMARVHFESDPMEGYVFPQETTIAPASVTSGSEAHDSPLVIYALKALKQDKSLDAPDATIELPVHQLEISRNSVVAHGQDILIKKVPRGYTHLVVQGQNLLADGMTVHAFPLRQQRQADDASVKVKDEHAAE